MNVSIETGAEDAFLANGFECVEAVLAVFFDEINFTEGSLPDAFVEFEAGEGDVFDFVLFLDELIHFEDISPAGGQFILLLLLPAHCFGEFQVLLWRYLQHPFDYCAMIGSVSMERIDFFTFLIVG